MFNLSLHLLLRGSRLISSLIQEFSRLCILNVGNIKPKEDENWFFNPQENFDIAIVYGEYIKRYTTSVVLKFHGGEAIRKKRKST